MEYMHIITGPEDIIDLFRLLKLAINPNDEANRILTNLINILPIFDRDDINTILNQIADSGLIAPELINAYLIGLKNGSKYKKASGDRILLKQIQENTKASSTFFTKLQGNYDNLMKDHQSLIGTHNNLSSAMTKLTSLLESNRNQISTKYSSPLKMIPLSTDSFSLGDDENLVFPYGSGYFKRENLSVMITSGKVTEITSNPPRIADILTSMANNSMELLYRVLRLTNEGIRKFGRKGQNVTHIMKLYKMGDVREAERLLSVYEMDKAGWSQVTK